jgi:hypothetical protein
MTATFGRVAANILAVGLIALAAHSWPVREYVRTLVAVRAGHLVGADVSIGELKYKLSTLAFEADNVLVSSRHPDVGGQLFVPPVAVQLSWPALLAGRLEPNQLHVRNLEASASARGNEASAPTCR